jgi:hypothetical protein
MLGLRKGSICNNYDIIFLISLEKDKGIGGYCPFTIFRAKKCKESALKGGLKAHNSYKITPKDHISVLNEYGLLSIISGDK